MKSAKHPTGKDCRRSDIVVTTELVPVSATVPATKGRAILPELVERAGGAARFAWEEFFFAEHHNLHTQRAYESAVRRFLAWAEGQGVVCEHFAGHGRPIPDRPGRLASKA